MASPEPAGPRKPPRVMLDATVLFAGSGWPRWSYEVLRHAAREDFQLVLTPGIITQAQRNLQAKAPRRASFLQEWLRTCPLETVARPSLAEIAANHNLVRQAEDVPIALAAIKANVDYFVSEDKDFTERSATTHRIHRVLTIMRPVIFLREVMGWSSEDLEKIRKRSWPLEEN
jgi:predicted nucleic acid-binding protein